MEYADSQVFLYASRLETDEEYNNRVQKTKEILKKTEASEYEAYLKLKDKFEPLPCQQESLLQAKSNDLA